MIINVLLRNFQPRPTAIQIIAVKTFLVNNDDPAPRDIIELVTSEYKMDAVAIDGHVMK